MLGKSPIKWRQRPNMTIAVDWGVKHPFKLKKKNYCNCISSALDAESERIVQEALDKVCKGEF